MDKYWVKLYEADRRFRDIRYAKHPRYYSASEAIDLVEQIQSQLEEAKWPSDIQWWRKP